MASFTIKNLDVSKSSVSGSVNHESPALTASFTLSTDLNLSVSIDNYASNATFHGNVGYVVKDKNGKEHYDYEYLFITNGTFGDITTVEGIEKSGKPSFNSYKIPSDWVFPISLSFICELCNTEYDSGSGNFVYKKFDNDLPNSNGASSGHDTMYYMQAADEKYYRFDIINHVCESAPSKPTLSDITCNSITVTGGEYVREGTNGTWYASPHTFTGYGHATTHTFYAANKCSCGTYYVSASGTEGTTKKKKAAPTASITNITGTTITVTGGTKVRKGSNGTWYDSPHTFTGLSNGTSYDFYAKHSCDCGEEIISSKITGKTWGYSHSLKSRTTKSLTFDVSHTVGINNGTSQSQKRIKCALYYNSSGEHKETKYVSGGSGTVTFNNLPHNTNYKCSIYTENIEYDGSPDNGKTITASTKQLSLVGISDKTEQHQHSIITYWQAKIDSEVHNEGVDGNSLTFSATSAAKKTTDKDADGDKYQTPTEGSNGSNSDTISGNYIKNTSSNLTWYHCRYAITGTVSDGYNEVQVTMDDENIHTSFPYTWIHNGSKWCKAKPYVYDSSLKLNGTRPWIPAAIFVGSGSAYKEPNGE